MEHLETADKLQTHHHHHHHKHEHIVEVSIDGHPKSIVAATYLVSRLKELLGVPADYRLELVVKGEFKPLEDKDEIKIKDHEVFVSHVCRGGSS